MACANFQRHSKVPQVCFIIITITGQYFFFPLPFFLLWNDYICFLLLRTQGECSRTYELVNAGLLDEFCKPIYLMCNFCVN